MLSYRSAVMIALVLDVLWVQIMDACTSRIVESATVGEHGCRLTCHSDAMGDDAGAGYLPVLRC